MGKTMLRVQISTQYSVADARRVVQAVGSLFGQGDEDLDSGALPGRVMNMGKKTPSKPGR